MNPQRASVRQASQRCGCRNYDAAFLIDPDGNNIEAVCME
jgi:hypothetical protein